MHTAGLKRHNFVLNREAIILSANMSNKENINIHIKYPFIVRVSDKIGNHFCTGTFVSPSLVLSAASCFVREKAAASVVYGCKDLDSGSCKRIPVTNTIFHPKFSKFNLEKLYDLALLRLRFKSIVQLPLLLAPIPNKKFFNNKQNIQIGWENIIPERYGASTAGKLKETAASVVENSVCEKQNNRILELKQEDFFEVHDSLICSTNEDEGICEEDKGAPSFIYCEQASRSVLIGVASAAFSCGIPGHTTISTRTFADVNFQFIEDQIILLNEKQEQNIMRNLSFGCPELGDIVVSSPTAFPTINAKEWTCDGSYYAAQDGCDCECGIPDPDCLFGSQHVFGCAEQFEVCNEQGNCEIRQKDLLVPILGLILLFVFLICCTVPGLICCGVLKCNISRSKYEHEVKESE